MGLHIQRGDIVMVVLPDPKDPAVRMLLKYDRQEMMIAKRVAVRGYRSEKADRKYYYELVGAVSENGHIPYSFMHDWLIRV